MTFELAIFGCGPQAIAQLSACQLSNAHVRAVASSDQAREMLEFPATRSSRP